jgi:uncharacterized protein (TIGR03437 family)
MGDMQSKKVLTGKIAVAAAVLPILLYAFATGPDPGHTGAPGEQTCAMAGCHTGTAVNGGGGSVTITTSSTYSPGVKQRVTVSVNDTNRRRWGFQFTARSGTEFRTQAGTFTSVDTFTQELCSNANFIQSACNASAIYRFIEHTQAGTRNGTTTGPVTFEFDWTPPADATGPIRLYVAGNAASGDGTNSGDRIYTANMEVTRGGTIGPKPAISQNGVVNGASFVAPIAPNSWITVRGTELAGTTRENTAAEIVNGRRPTSMDGISVTVNNKPAFFYFISPGQLNVVSPDDDATGPVPVKVTRDGVESEVATVTQQKYSPAFFLWPNNQAVATDQNFALRVKNGTFAGATTVAAQPGEVLILWGTGFGPTTPAVPAGQVVTGSATVSGVTVTVGGVPAEVFGTALAPTFTALYQVAIRVPASLQNGDHPVIATIEGVSSPATTVIAVQR